MQYDLDTKKLTFEEFISGLSAKCGQEAQEAYIKLSEVEQFEDGSKYAIVYNNDGIFYLRTFGKIQ